MQKGHKIQTKHPTVYFQSLQPPYGYISYSTSLYGGGGGICPIMLQVRTLYIHPLFQLFVLIYDKVHFQSVWRSDPPKNKRAHMYSYMMICYPMNKEPGAVTHLRHRSVACSKLFQADFSLNYICAR